MNTLKGKRIVLLGGTSGFGLATAKAAAEEGAEVIVASSSQARVDAALASLPAGSAGYAANLTDETAVKELFEKIGAFDHLVFTAGEALLISKLDNMDFEAAKAAFNLRFWGAMMAAKYAAGSINKGGSITLTTGIAGLRPWKDWSVAAGVTGAIESLARALAVELAPIRVNAVSAGVVNTNLWGNMPDADRLAMFAQVGSQLPVGRVGEAEDLALCYLCLMKQPFSTGQTIIVDGGAVIV
jgi:NAD(P)-dependent dehydrogenase (short-subunit alcohol dehydrogenase family)